GAEPFARARLRREARRPESDHEVGLKQRLARAGKIGGTFTSARSPMAKLTQSVDLTNRGRVAVLTVDNPPVNALSQHVRQGLKDGITQAQADAAVQAIVIVCAGRTFIAGADITEFGKTPQEPGLHGVLDLIEG